jgi:quinol-cytochrome oxidoreductase complex cytochrome b subunit
MNFNNITKIWKQLLWPWNPDSNFKAGDAIVKNFLLHWFPNRITLKSLSFNYSMYLGTITFVLFLILTVTGIVLMFLYVPSVERAYWTMKDLDFAVSFGWFLRRLHRVAAHLMVVAVFLHMFRVFYTSAYKNGTTAGSNRSFNWVLGVVLLVLTLLLSYTGYLLPWDQLAYWAVTVGTSVAAAVPFIGEQIKELMIGGTLIGQTTLLRFYVLHVFVLPAVLFAFAIWHMWRIRKDGGLAIVEQVRNEINEQELQQPKQGKTYSILGIRKGVTVQVRNPTVLSEKNSLCSSPHLTMRILNITLITLFITILLSIFIPAPLEELANPEVTPNPAKAPWYFLGLQELISYSGFVGGILIPFLAILGFAVIPYIDTDQKNIGIWFTDSSGKRWAWIGALWGFLSSILVVFLGLKFPMRTIFSGIESQLFFEIVNPAVLLMLTFVALYIFSYKTTSSNRTAWITTFTAFIIVFILLTYTASVLRGPNWLFYWPWEAWPTHPIPY